MTAFQFQKSLNGLLRMTMLTSRTYAGLGKMLIRCPGELQRNCTRNFSSLQVYCLAETLDIGNGSIINIHSIRHKSSGRRPPIQTEDDGDSDAEDAEQLDSDEEDVPMHPDDYDMPDNFKDIQVHVQSLRTDGVLSRALNTPRNTIDTSFLGSKIRVNGETLTKKSRKLKEDDAVDLILTVRDDIETFKRIRILDIGEDKTSKEKFRVKVRAWRGKVQRQAENTWSR